MNREQRRKYNKANKTNYTKEQFAMAEAYERIQSGNFNLTDLMPHLPSTTHLDNVLLAPDGTKVKLNIDNLFLRPHTGLTEKFLSWVEANKDTVFTLSREGSKQSLVCLKESEPVVEGDNMAELSTENKWLFDLYSDLLIWDETQKDFRTLFAIESDQLLQQTDAEKEEIEDFLEENEKEKETKKEKENG